MDNSRRQFCANNLGTISTSIHKQLGVFSIQTLASILLVWTNNYRLLKVTMSLKVGPKPSHGRFRLIVKTNSINKLSALTTPRIYIHETNNRTVLARQAKLCWSSSYMQSRLINWVKVYVPPNTKTGISETLFPANLSTLYWKTKTNTTKANKHP